MYALDLEHQISNLFGVFTITLIVKLYVSRGTDAQSVTVQPTGCEFNPHFIYEYLFYTSISLLWCQGKARR